MGLDKAYIKFLKKPYKITKEANHKERSRLNASLQARALGLAKIGSSVVAIPVFTAVGIVAGPFGVAGMAVASTFCMVPVIMWGVGDLICPELIYCLA